MHYSIVKEKGLWARPEVSGLVLDLGLPWMQEIGRPLPPKHIPVVLSSDEVKQILFLMDGVVGLLARLLYGTGMRLREGLSLRVKDIDFERNVVIVREGKGGKDRVVMLPIVLKPALKEQLAYARAGETSGTGHNYC
jgi:integrase